MGKLSSIYEHVSIRNFRLSQWANLADRFVCKCSNEKERTEITTKMTTVWLTAGVGGRYVLGIGRCVVVVVIGSDFCVVCVGGGSVNGTAGFS